MLLSLSLFGPPLHIFHESIDWYSFGNAVPGIAFVKHLKCVYVCVCARTPAHVCERVLACVGVCVRACCRWKGQQERTESRRSRGGVVEDGGQT